MIGYSRGALVTQLALESVRDMYHAEGRSDQWVAEHAFNHVSVETLNGASHHMPAGVSAEHYISNTDFLVSQTIGMGVAAPAIRGMSAGAIDGALAAYSTLSPAQKLVEAKDMTALAVDALKYDVHTRLFAGRPNLAQADVASFEGHLSKLGRDVQPPTPGLNELLRDGAGNTPNGPIHHIPGLIDAPALTDPVSIRGDVRLIVDQHDAPAVIPYLKAHATHTEAIPGNLPEAEKNRVDLAMPEKGGRGGALPRPTSIDAWDGKAHSGTIFKVDDETYAIHVGKGAYQVLDKDRDLQGQTPANGSYVDLNQSGRVELDRTQTQQHHMQR